MGFLVDKLKKDLKVSLGTFLSNFIRINGNEALKSANKDRNNSVQIPEIDYFVTYTFDRDPQFSEEYLDFEIVGSIAQEGSQIPTKQGIELPETYQSREVAILIGEDFVGQFLQASFASGDFKTSFNSTQVPESSPFQLNTDSLALLLPDIKEKYPIKENI